MPAVTIRNLSQETHRALKRRARLHGSSTEGEIRMILEEAVRPRIKIGSELVKFGTKNLGKRPENRPRFPANRASGVRLIILDTNVISEPMRLQGDPAVQAWLDRQEAETLYVTAISLSELLVGIELVPTGKRRSRLAVSLTRLLERLFGPRILAFDRPAAIAYASVMGRTRRPGTRFR